MATDPKEIVDGCMDKEEALNLSRRFEASHVAFALPCGLMGDLSSIVGVLRGAVVDGGEGRPMSRGIAAQLISDESIRYVA